MAHWFLSIDVAAPNEDGRIVDRERFNNLVDMMDKLGFPSTATGGEREYGVVSDVGVSDIREVYYLCLDAFDRSRNEVDLPDWPIVRFEAITDEAFSARRSRQVVPRFFGAQEAIAALGFSKQRFSDLLNQGRLPEPLTRLAATPIWLATTIEKYAETRRRTPGRIPANWVPADVPTDDEAITAVVATTDDDESNPRQARHPKAER